MMRERGRARTSCGCGWGRNRALPEGAMTPQLDLTERESIASTIAAVAHCIDHKQWRELRALFTDKVRTDYTSLFGGEAQDQPGDALIQAWRGLPTPVVTQHVLGPIAVEVSGTTVTARCHVRGYHYVKGAPGGEEWMVAGHYVFGLTNDGAMWK